MRNLRYLTVAFLAALLGIVPLLAATRQAAQPSAGNAELQKLVDSYSAAWAKGDAAALAALYTTDAIYIDSGNVLMKGRSEIETTFKQRFGGDLKGTTITISPGQTQQLTPDVQISEGAWQIAGVPPAAEAAKKQPLTSGAAATAGRYLNTLVRQEGRWLIAATAGVPEAPKVP
jgi:uncharacterized protein (TIGR02246 family)